MAWAGHDQNWGSVGTDAFDSAPSAPIGAEGYGNENTQTGDIGNENAGYETGGGINSGACFNCGEEGHMKADCPNPTVEREFTGTCRICDEQGHRASACPNAPPKLCDNCKEAGHPISECTNPRKVDRSGIADIPAERAWKEVQNAASERDMEDVKDAVEKYVKACPEITYAQLEHAFRSQNVGVYLICIEKELATTYTNMDLQGNLKKKYTVTWHFSPKAPRPKDVDYWPQSAEENQERLQDCGIPVDCLMPKCSNCNELGHTKKFCPQDVQENADKAEVKCFNCDAIGHRVRDCPNERPDKFACRNCKKSGHNSKECPEPRSAEGVECKVCGEIGHFSRDCPTAEKVPCFNCGETGHRKNECTNERVLTCRNCDETGHVAKECPKPRDYSRVKCSNCGEMGHTKVRCKQPIADGDEAGDGDAFGGGESGNIGFNDTTGNNDYYGVSQDAGSGLGEHTGFGGGANW